MGPQAVSSFANRAMPFFLRQGYPQEELATGAGLNEPRVNSAHIIQCKPDERRERPQVIVVLLKMKQALP